MKYIFWLGSHPVLSLKELTTVLERELPGSYSLEFEGQGFVVVELMRQLRDTLIDELGGVDRIGQVLAMKDSPFQETDVAKWLPAAADKKILVGVSYYGHQRLNLKKFGVSLKRLARDRGLRMNFITPSGNGSRLNAAQVIFNKLIEEPNNEFSIVDAGETHWLARTCQVQDIEAYEIRDTLRPARDTKIGMLPPKLAQILINLVPEFTSRQPKIYDPFCGMGTVLQEVWLRGWVAVGSDNDENMVEASKVNLEWLSDKLQVNQELKPQIFAHNIREAVPAELINAFDAVVTEPFLGPPLNHPLSADQIRQRQNELRNLYLRFFQNARAALVEKGWIVTILPAFALKAGHGKEYVTFPSSLVDDLMGMGYIIKHLSDDSRGIIYARQDAFVAREITVWQKK